MPLSAYSVLEASGEVAVRYVGRLFARLGARVDRVVRGDDRQIGYAGAKGEAYGRWLDQGKRRLTAAPTSGRYDLVIGGQDAAGVAAAQAVANSLGGDPLLLALTWFDPGGGY